MLNCPSQFLQWPITDRNCLETKKHQSPSFPRTNHLSPLFPQWPITDYHCSQPTNFYPQHTKWPITNPHCCKSQSLFIIVSRQLITDHYGSQIPFTKPHCSKWSITTHLCFGWSLTNHQSPQQSTANHYFFQWPIPNPHISRQSLAIVPKDQQLSQLYPNDQSQTITVPSYQWLTDIMNHCLSQLCSAYTKLFVL